MVQVPLRWLYARLGRRYVRAALAVQFQFTVVTVAGGVLLMTLFVDVSRHDLLWTLIVAEGLVVLENVAALSVVFRLVRPADPWLLGDHDPDAALRAWRTLAGLPRAFLSRGRALVIVLNTVPVSVFITLQLGLPLWPSLLVFVAGSAVVLLYGTLLRFFAIEAITRPVLEDLSCDIPPQADLQTTTVSLRARLLLALPAINIIGGVVVSGLSSPSKSVAALGLGVAVAIVVAFTISLELSLLLAASILGPLRDLRRGTERVAAGDLDVRVPVVSADETGRLAASFNQMVSGLAERERLREAFGAYVDPGLAERVLREGTELAGEEVEVTVLFLDIRDFTAFAEHAGAREVVATLNAFYEVVVPVLRRHGGHADKFIGDGLLAVFGAPERQSDHADRAVAAAREVVAAVRARYGDTLRIGVGINTGPVVAGSVGGGGRFDFTVIGDAVNTAARVEGITRRTGDDILLTAATREALRRDHGAFAAREPVVLKGKSARVSLFAPVDGGEDVQPAVGRVAAPPAAVAG